MCLFRTHCSSKIFLHSEHVYFPLVIRFSSEPVVCPLGGEDFSTLEVVCVGSEFKGSLPCSLWSVKSLVVCPYPAHGGYGFSDLNHPSHSNFRGVVELVESKQ
jgi:hypothetical protein